MRKIRFQFMAVLGMAELPFAMELLVDSDMWDENIALLGEHLASKLGARYLQFEGV